MMRRVGDGNPCADMQQALDALVSVEEFLSHVINDPERPDTERAAFRKTWVRVMCAITDVRYETGLFPSCWKEVTDDENDQ